jgi:hypothetical protein
MVGRVACADNGLDIVNFRQAMIRIDRILGRRGEQVGKEGVDQQQRNGHEKTDGHEHGASKVSKIGLIHVG